MILVTMKLYERPHKQPGYSEKIERFCPEVNSNVTFVVSHNDYTDGKRSCQSAYNCAADKCEYKSQK